MAPRFAIALLTTFALSSVAAAHGGRGQGKRFEALDTDGNGSISLAELTSEVRERFAKFDLNGDGRVEQQEMKAHHEAKRAQWAQKRAEHEAAAKAKDPERWARRAERRAQKMEKNKAHMEAKMAERFQRLDGNHDGVIDRSEVDAHAQQRFGKLDRNRDGAIDRDEMRGARWGKHEGMRHRRGRGHGKAEGRPQAPGQKA